MDFLKKLSPLGLLLLRCGLALVFITHGYPKLFVDPDKFTEAFHNIGLPGYFAYITGTIELLGGAALALGVFTPVAGLLLLLDMIGAMWKYNFHEGIYAVSEYELPLILGLGALALATIGPGPISLDQLIFRRKAPRSPT